MGNTRCPPSENPKDRKRRKGIYPPQILNFERGVGIISPKELLSSLKLHSRNFTRCCIQPFETTKWEHVTIQGLSQFKFMTVKVARRYSEWIQNLPTVLEHLMHKHMAGPVQIYPGCLSIDEVFFALFCQETETPVAKKALVYLDPHTSRDYESESYTLDVGQRLHRDVTKWSKCVYVDDFIRHLRMRDVCIVRHMAPTLAAQAFEESIDLEHFSAPS